MTTAHTDFGPYRLIEKLGDGPVGDVFRAARQGADGLEQLVALKRIYPPIARDPGFARAFLQSASRASKLQHTGLAHVLDQGSRGHELYVASELKTGYTLQRVLDYLRGTGYGLEPGLVIALARQVAEALRGAHAARTGERSSPFPLVHGNIKPSNILIEPTGNVVLLDLGASVACALEPEGPLVWLSRDSIRFLAPEQVRGSEPDPRTDVYSLGALMFELLTLEPLIEVGPPLEMLRQVVDIDLLDRLKLLKELGIEPDVSRVLHGALQKKPRARFPDAGTFADALAAVPSGLARSEAEHWVELLAELRGEDTLNRLEAGGVGLAAGDTEESLLPWDFCWQQDSVVTEHAWRLGSAYFAGDNGGSSLAASGNGRTAHGMAGGTPRADDMAPVALVRPLPSGSSGGLTSPSLPFVTGSASDAYLASGQPFPLSQATGIMLLDVDDEEDDWPADEDESSISFSPQQSLAYAGDLDGTPVAPRSIEPEELYAESVESHEADARYFASAPLELAPEELEDTSELPEDEADGEGDDDSDSPHPLLRGDEHSDLARMLEALEHSPERLAEVEAARQREEEQAQEAIREAADLLQRDRRRGAQLAQEDLGVSEDTFKTVSIPEAFTILPVQEEVVSGFELEAAADEDELEGFEDTSDEDTPDAYASDDDDEAVAAAASQPALKPRVGAAAGVTGEEVPGIAPSAPSERGSRSALDAVMPPAVMSAVPVPPWELEANAQDSGSTPAGDFANIPTKEIPAAVMDAETAAAVEALSSLNLPGEAEPMIGLPDVVSTVLPAPERGELAAAVSLLDDAPALEGAAAVGISTASGEAGGVEGSPDAARRKAEGKKAGGRKSRGQGGSGDSLAADGVVAAIGIEVRSSGTPRPSRSSRATVPSISTASVFAQGTTEGPATSEVIVAAEESVAPSESRQSFPPPISAGMGTPSEARATAAAPLPPRSAEVSGDANAGVVEREASAELPALALADGESEPVEGPTSGREPQVVEGVSFVDTEAESLFFGSSRGVFGTRLGTPETLRGAQVGALEPETTGGESPGLDAGAALDAAEDSLADAEAEYARWLEANGGALALSQQPAGEENLPKLSGTEAPGISAPDASLEGIQSAVAALSEAEALLAAETEHDADAAAGLEPHAEDVADAPLVIDAQPAENVALPIDASPGFEAETPVEQDTSAGSEEVTVEAVAKPLSVDAEEVSHDASDLPEGPPTPPGSEDFSYRSDEIPAEVAQFAAEMHAGAGLGSSPYPARTHTETTVEISIHDDVTFDEVVDGEVEALSQSDVPIPENVSHGPYDLATAQKHADGRLEEIPADLQFLLPRPVELPPLDFEEAFAAEEAVEAADAEEAYAVSDGEDDEDDTEESEGVDASSGDDAEAEGALVASEPDGDELAPSADARARVGSSNPPASAAVASSSRDAVSHVSPWELPRPAAGDAGDSVRTSGKREAGSRVVVPASRGRTDGGAGPKPEPPVPGTKVGKWLRPVSRRPTLEEGALVGGRYRVEGLLLEFPERSIYSVILLDEDGFRHCGNCNFTRNNAEDNYCQQCGTSLSSQRMTLSMRWDKRRIERDMQIASRELKHPGLAPIYHQFVEAGRLYRVLDLVTEDPASGVLLMQLVGPLEIPMLGEIGVQAALALHALHEQGINCPFLSEDNIFLHDEHVQLYDLDVDEALAPGNLTASMRIKDVMVLARVLIPYLPQVGAELVTLLRDAAEGRISNAEDFAIAVQEAAGLPETSLFPQGA